MPALRPEDIIEDAEPVRVVDDRVFVALDYRGSAHALSGDGTTTLKTLSAGAEVGVPLIDLGESPDFLECAVRLIVAVVRSRPLTLRMGRYVDADLREMLQTLDPRGLTVAACRMVVDPVTIKSLPRWVSTETANLPESWIVGLAKSDVYKPIVRVCHQGRYALVTRDPMIVGAYL